MRCALRPTVLLALAPGDDGARSAQYARGVCKRIGAGLEILVWPGEEGRESFLRDFTGQLSGDDIPWRTEKVSGCLKERILEGSRRSDIRFVVVDSTRELGAGCDKESAALRNFFVRLSCPLVVVSEAQGMA